MLPKPMLKRVPILKSRKFIAISLVCRKRTANRRALCGALTGTTRCNYAASVSIKPISALDISLSMSTRISMRSSMVPRPIR